MASDTGAPWQLPYPEDTDLVRDGAADIEALAVATAANLAKGIGPNVVQTVKTDTFTATLDIGLNTDITGLTATITPSSTSSLVLVVVSVTAFVSGGGNYVLLRGTTELGLGDADGSRSRRTFNNGNNETFAASTNTFTFLDSPSTDSPTTYSVKIGHNVAVDARDVFVNRSELDQNLSSRSRYSSQITLIEVNA